MRDYTFDNMPIVSISGKLSRKSDVYYRTINGKIYAYLLWNPNTKPPTLGTLRTRQIFKKRTRTWASGLSRCTGNRTSHISNRVSNLLYLSVCQ
ncbi:MAG: hypothetical protein KBT40_05035 [bacterium]|nr:hypothetical protein [Candidatus Minthenecus merdequi]